MLDLLRYGFIWHALIGCLLTGVACGLIGSYVATRRMVFIAGGVAHASLGGVGLCALLGGAPIVGATLFGVLTACGIHHLSIKGRVRSDSAIAMWWAVGMSLGVICLFLSPKYLPSLSSYLFGNILYATGSDLWFLSVVTLFVAVLFIFRLPQIVALAFDPVFAHSGGMKVDRLELILLILTALCIVACLRTVGIVMVIALMSIPQTIAAQVFDGFKAVAIASVLVSILACLVGLWLSYTWNIPSGPAIVLVCVVIYLAVYAIKKAVRRFL